MPERSVPWRVEHACFKAFPAREQVVRGQWLLRFSDGMSRRANSVNPLVCSCPDIEATIDAAETQYLRRGLPAIFRVPSFVSPLLDRALAARHYAREGESCVLHCAIQDLRADEASGVDLLPTPETAWLAAMAKLQAHAPAQAAAYRAIVAAVAIPARFASLTVDGEPAALAFAAVYERVLCYESVVVAPELRRQGLARRLLGALAGWGRSSGAAEACLQVQADNAAARALYARLGLGEIYRYHYRRAPAGREVAQQAGRNAPK